MPVLNILVLSYSTLHCVELEGPGKTWSGWLHWLQYFFCGLQSRLVDSLSVCQWLTCSVYRSNGVLKSVVDGMVALRQSYLYARWVELKGGSPLRPIQTHSDPDRSTPICYKPASHLTLCRYGNSFIRLSSSLKLRVPACQSVSQLSSIYYLLQYSSIHAVSST